MFHSLSHTRSFHYLFIVFRTKLVRFVSSTLFCCFIVFLRFSRFYLQFFAYDTNRHEYARIFHCHISWDMCWLVQLTFSSLSSSLFCSENKKAWFFVAGNSALYTYFVLFFIFFSLFLCSNGGTCSFFSLVSTINAEEFLL